MTTYHTLTPELFDRLAAGGGGSAGVAALRAAQLSKHLLLIRHLLDGWPGPVTERDAIATALDLARRAQPDRFAEVVGGPLVGAWAAIVSRAHRRRTARWTDFAHLGSIAAVACGVAGVEAALDAPVRDGTVALPSLGTAAVGTAADTDEGHRARIVTGDGHLTVHGEQTIDVRTGGETTNVPGWRPVRYLSAETAGQRLRLALDDLDPYRHGHHAPPTDRLTIDEVRRWRSLFTDAWRLLASHVPERAAELATGLRVLVPLRQDEHAARSATIRHAFGVFGLSRPLSAADFAVTMVHEFQHSKLSAVLDLTRLTDPADDRRYFAPWRTDARPLSGLLQGVYAFVGVADTWRALRHADGLTDLAEARFAQARLQVDRGAAAVETSGALTSEGASFVSRLRRVVDAMLDDPVPDQVSAAAENSLASTWRRWQERNGAVA